MNASFPVRLKRGISAALQGIAHVSRSPDVRRAYRFILFALFLLSVLISSAGAYAVLSLTAVKAEASFWITLGMWLLRILGVILVFLVAPIVSITICNLLFPVFSEIPFFAGLRAMDYERAARLQARRGLGTRAAIVTSLRRSGAFLVTITGCLLLGLIPVVGPILALPLQFYFAARTVGWEMLDPYLDRLSVSYPDQKRVVRAFGPEILGLGLVYAPLLSIPLVGPLLFGLLQAGAAKFVATIMPPGDSKEDLLASCP